MMLPLTLWRRCGTAAWAQNRTPSRLTASTRRHCSGEIAASGVSSVMAALLTSTSSCPQAAIVAATALTMLARSDTSTGTA